VASGQRDRAQRAEAEARARADELAVVADFQAGMLEQIDATASGIFLTEDVMAKLGTALEGAGVAADERDAQLEAFRGQWARVNATDAARDLIVHTILTPAAATVDERFEDQPVVAAQLRQVLGDRYRELGLFDAARPLQETALETRRRELGDEHPDTLTSVHNMTVLLVAQGKADEAEAFAVEALEGRRRVLGDDRPGVLNSINNFGMVLLAAGKLDEAETFVREGVEGRQRVLGEDLPTTLGSLINLGTVLQRQNDFRAAEPVVLEAYETSRRVLGEEHSTTLISAGHLGSVYVGRGKNAEAVALLVPLEDLARETFTGSKASYYALIARNLGIAEARLAGSPAEFAAAEAALLEAYDVVVELRSEAHKAAREAARALADLHAAWDRVEPGHGHDAESREWRAKGDPGE
jgi:tetratricopeptide (TPR) repeat protein